MDILLRVAILCLLVVFYVLYGLWFVILIVKGRDDKK